MVHVRSLSEAEHPLFPSFFLGGFECSSPPLHSGKRLDLVAATAHDRHARADYLRLRDDGIRTACNRIHWHLIEVTPDRYDWTRVEPMLRAAPETGVKVIWDLFHYGYLDDLDPFSPGFVRRFGGLARAFTELLIDGGDDAPYIAPVNEPSFVAWAGGASGLLPPFAHGRSRSRRLLCL